MKMFRFSTFLTLLRSYSIYLGNRQERSLKNQVSPCFGKKENFILPFPVNVMLNLSIMSATQATVTSTQVTVMYRRNVSSLSIDMSADNRTTALGRHIDRHNGRVLVEISTDDRPICRSICRPTHLDRYIGRVSVDVTIRAS